MAKRKTRGRKSAAPPARRRAPVKVVAAALLVALAASGAAVSRWNALRAPLGLSPVAAPAQATPSPLTWAKDYVYAGGRLVATEEPEGVTFPRSGCCRDADGKRIPDCRCINAHLPAPDAFTARAESTTQVALTWNTSGQGLRYQVERSGGVGGPYTTLATGVEATAFTDVGAAPGTAYLYRVRALDQYGDYSQYSVDLATTVAFTNRPLQSGVTVIRAQHLVELRQAVGAVRTLAGIGPASWTYPDPVSEPASQRRAIYLKDVAELRTQLDAALAALNRSQAYPAEPALARGAKVYKEHFQQIRDRVE